jgi:hypothetical protein
VSSSKLAESLSIPDHQSAPDTRVNPAFPRKRFLLC